MPEVGGRTLVEKLRATIDAQHKVEQAARDAAAGVQAEREQAEPEPAPPAEPEPAP
jgi:hypothetical protein